MICSDDTWKPNLKLPKSVKKDQQLFCRCRPVCPHKRRILKGKELTTPAEDLLVKEKPPYLKYKEKGCFRTCPLRSKIPFNADKFVTVCQTPLPPKIDITYLNFIEVAKKLGAWQQVFKRCKKPFCSCCHICTCDPMPYESLDPDHSMKRRAEMRNFDRRVKTESKISRIMYA